MVNLVVACWYCFKIGIAVLLFLAVVGCWCSNEAYRTNVIYGTRSCKTPGDEAYCGSILCILFEAALILEDLFVIF